MRSVLSIVLILTICGLQVNGNYDVHQLRTANRATTTTNIDRSLSDVWETIKNTFKNAISSINDMAEKTKDKINKWMNDTKDRAKNLVENFKEKVKELREKSRKMLEDVVGEEAAQKITDCFKEETDANELLKQLIKNVTLCISEGLINVRYLSRSVPNIEKVNETELLIELEVNFKECIKINSTELCFNEARRDVLNYMDVMEKDILKDKDVSRGIIDDLFEKAASCAYEGLIKASHIIASETLQVVACVIKN